MPNVHLSDEFRDLRRSLGKLYKEHSAMQENDPTNPSHYKSGGLECIDVIEAFRLGFRLGNAIKYILRAGKKGNKIEDLRKAMWYIDREIKRSK